MRPRTKHLPQFVSPMMASVVKEPFEHPDWIFETKLDGFRVIAVIDSAGKARIWSRNRLPLEPKFPTVLGTIDQLELRSTILDGEIVALDAEGIPRFQLLQEWQKRPTAPVVYFLFDLLWSDGRDLTGKTVLQRRKRLQEIITPEGCPGRERKRASLALLVCRRSAESVGGSKGVVLGEPGLGLRLREAFKRKIGGRRSQTSAHLRS